MKKHILSKKCWCKPDVISFNQAMNKKIDSQKMDIYPKMSNYTQHETHTACIDRIKKEGASVTCCDCNPHEGCTLNDRLPEASKTIDTQTDWEDKIRFLLENLIVDIGIQVTDDYKNKNGLYEGMSIKNARSRDKYIKLFINLLADARREVITGETSDGYHTFNELYEFRKLFNALLFNEWAKQGIYDIHKSTRHFDGEKCFGGGWFIVMANTPKGQISNHYEMKDWDLFRVATKYKANKWDGHTAQDVLKTLSVLATLRKEERL